MGTDHVILLGKVMGNFHSLETLLRLYLHAVSPAGKNSGHYWGLQKGQVLEVDAFTNWDALGTLVRKFNGHVDLDTPGSRKVDPKVADLRDLLAHGRVSAEAKDLTKRKTVKFDKPANGKVTVTDCATMDDAWLQGLVDLVRAQMKAVGEGLGRVGAGGFVCP